MAQYQDYRRVGGWLMFIKVMAIIFIVCYSMSLLSSAFSAFGFGFLEAVFYSIGDIPYEFYAFDGIFSYLQFFFVYILIVSILCLAASICVLVFLQKRNLNNFKVSFFSGFGVIIIGYIVQMVYFAANPIGRMMQNFMESVYAYDSYGYYDTFPYGLAEYWDRSFMVSSVVCLLIAIGLVVAWFFYFQRSQRVRVYFDQYYVDPAYPSYYSAPAAPTYADQIPASTGVSSYSAGYTPPVNYDQQQMSSPYQTGTGYPAQGYFPQAGYPVPPSGVYPPPAQPYSPQQPAAPHPYGYNTERSSETPAAPIPPQQPPTQE